MIWLTLRPSAGSRVATPTKSGIAIGIGWMLPWVTSSLSAAPVRRGQSPASAPAAVAVAPSMISRRRLKESLFVIEARSIMTRSSCAAAASISAQHLARIESDLDVFPLLVSLGPKHVVGRAADDGAHGAVTRRHEKRAPAAVGRHRRSGKRAVGLEQDPDLHDDLLRILGASRRRPQLREALAQRVELAQGDLRRVAFRCAECGRAIERLARGC